jgi:hypothetical protein
VLHGYARVSTADQNPDAQRDALLRVTVAASAGVHPDQLYLDHTSGAKSSRPAWDALSKAPRAGDVLVATRLDRVGSLVTLLDQLAGRGVAFRFLEQGIDTTTSEGRADVSDAGRHRRVPAGLDHHQHAKAWPPRAPEAEKEGANPNSPRIRFSWLSSSTTPERKPSPRSPRSSPCPAPPSTATSTTDPPAHDHEPANLQPQITEPTKVADSPGSPGAVLRPKPARIPQADDPSSAQECALRERLVRQREAMRAPRCPTCGNEPVEGQSRWRQRHDLAIIWLHLNGDELREQRHCVACQPHDQPVIIECDRCGDGPLITGLPANTPIDQWPPALTRWLHNNGWRTKPEPRCGNHR